ncbi:MAG TPA: sensor histidine kinase [Propionibacteriaceae bacterium]
MATLRRGHPLSVAGQILVLQVAVVLALVLVGLTLAYADARRDQERLASDRAVGVAVTVADAPVIATALREPNPTTLLQPFAERVRADSRTDFVVIMSTEGIRYTHPNPDNIGLPFLGSITQAQRGEVYTERYSGTLGPSVRAVVPVREGGTIVALVAVGITMQAVNQQVLASVPGIALAALVVLAVGVIGAALISRRLRRQTHGLQAAELSRMYEYYDAVLHSVREGVMVLDLDGRVQLINDEARRLLQLDGPAENRKIGELAIPTELATALLGTEPLTDEIHLVEDRMLVVNRARARWRGVDLGSAVTLRDHTELRSISGELDSVRDLAESLRSQNHESANRLHTVVSLIEMGRSEAAVDFATKELALAQRLTDDVVSAVDEPVVSALLLGKTSAAAERGVELSVDPGSEVTALPVAAHDVVTILGNLVDNAIDATADSDRVRRVQVLIRSDAHHLVIEVGDSGPGLTDDQREQAFRRGWSTKTGGGSAVGRGIGLALVINLVRRYGGQVDVGRSDLGGARFSLQVSTPAAVPTPAVQTPAVHTPAVPTAPAGDVS